VNLHLKYGLYEEALISITKKGKSGAEEIKAMMEAYRSNPPQSLGGSKVSAIKDYLSGEETVLSDGSKIKIDLPSSNVLQFITEDGSIISARPSGTEPKIKFYCSVNSPVNSRADYETVSAGLKAKIDRIMTDLQS